MGLLAVVSSRYDLLLQRDLETLEYVAMFSRFLWELGAIVSKAELNAQAAALEETAYQVKTPCQLLHRAVSRLSMALSESAQSATVERTLHHIKHWNLWLFNCTEKVLRRVNGGTHYMKLDRNSTSLLHTMLIDSFDTYLEFSNPKELRVVYSCDALENSFADICADSFLIAATGVFENAVKAASLKSVITVRIRGSLDKFCVAVRNEGAGVERSLLSKLPLAGFHMPYQIGAFYPPGAGFGLSITKANLEAMGGQLSLRSALGEYFEAELGLPAYLS